MWYFLGWFTIAVLTLYVLGWVGRCSFGLQVMDHGFVDYHILGEHETCLNYCSHSHPSVDRLWTCPKIVLKVSKSGICLNIS